MMSPAVADMLIGWMCVVFGGFAIWQLFKGDDVKLLQDSTISAMAAWWWRKMGEQDGG